MNPKTEEKIISYLSRNGLFLTTAESLTGGLLCARLINVSGASDCIAEGFITYSNEAKHVRLGVPETILAQKGAVSAECARAMAEGAARAAGADIALSATGIAGPTGGTDEKPVGLVYLGFYIKGKCFSEKCLFSGDRQSVREQTVERSLSVLASELSG